MAKGAKSTSPVQPQKTTKCTLFPASIVKVSEKLACRRPTENKKWITKHRRLREQWGLTDVRGAWSARHDLKGVSPSSRVVDCIDLCWQYHQKKGEVPPTLLTDVSQDVERKPWSGGTFPTLTTSSEIYCYAQDRMVLGLEHAAALGFDLSTFKAPVPNSTLKELTGDGMACPAVALIAASCLVALRL